MKPTVAYCPQCHAALPSDAPHGLCPNCLLAGVALATDAGSEPSRTPPPALESVAAAFPQLEILELIGRGGMGVVYKARQKSLNRLVALKLLAPERVTDAGFADRFAREAQALARLSHPNIVTIHDFGVTPTEPTTKNQEPRTPFYFLLMEFVDGVNLRQAMRAGRFTPEQALAIVPPVCEALQYAHDHGIVHRDIKPENLLLDKNGRVKIADFGIAKMLGDDGRAVSPAGDLQSRPATADATEGDRTAPAPTLATTAGTPGYMAPEQRIATQRVDSRADIYSLGVVLYELLTGELPAAQLQPPSRKVQIDVRLDEVVLRALETKPELRFQTAVEMRTQVELFRTAGAGEKREDRGEKIEKGQPPPPPSSSPSPLSSPGQPILKITTATLLTPAELATLSGQFFAHQTRGQLILDAQRLTHTRAGHTTVIPLAAIRDVSLGQYPRSMNPAGIALVSVTYEDAGQPRQVLLSPMDGWFALPSTWDANAADWHAAIRAAVKAATGREPTTTPREQLGIPGGFPWLQLAIVGVPLVAGLGLFLTSLSLTGQSPRSVLPVMLITLALTLGFILPSLFIPWATRRRAASGAPTATPAPSPGPEGRNLVWLSLFLILPMGLLSVVLFQSSQRVTPASALSPTTEFLVSLLGLVLVVPFLTLYLLPRWGRPRDGSQSPHAPRKLSLWPSLALSAFCAPLLVHLLLLPAGQVPPEPTHEVVRLVFSFPGALLLAALAGTGLWLRHRPEPPPAVPGDRRSLLGYGLALLCVPLVIHLLMLPAQLLLPEPARRGAPLPIGFPEAIILAVLGVVGLIRLRLPPAAPKSAGRSLLGVGLICFGMFLGGMKIQETYRDHVHRVNALTFSIPSLQQNWIAAGNEVFAANTELSRHIAQEPLARTDGERQRFLIEEGRLEGEVSKAKVRQDIINGQIRTIQDSIDALRFPTAADFLFVLKWSLPFVLAGLLVLAWRGRRVDGSAPSPRIKYLGLLLLAMPVLLVGFLFLQFYSRQSESTGVMRSTGVTQFSITPVGVSNHVVIVDVTADVERGNPELRAGLAGPALSAATEAALADTFVVPFTGTLVKPTLSTGNASWRILSTGRQTVRLGFVLPDAALARQAAANLQPIRTLPSAPVSSFVGRLFEVQQTNGQVYVASLQVELLRTAADPDWVSVSTFTQHNETSARLSWEILASQPGTAQFRREKNYASASLQRDPKSKLHRVNASLELTRVSSTRVRIVVKKGYATSTEEITANFRELADELLRSKHFSTKATSGTPIELCRVNGQPLTVTVEAAATGPESTRQPMAGQYGFGRTPGFPVVAALAGIMVLAFISGGIALLVWLLRRGGASTRTVLLVLAVPFVLLALAVAALIGWRATGGMRLEKFERMQLHANHTGPLSAEPPGRVQQTQNGFRLQLPAGQLATFELLIRQADDSLQPVPALAALVATSTNASFNDTLYWTLRRLGTENTSDYWSWSVTAHDGSGRPLAQRPDHGTNFSHALASGDTLDWWQLAPPGTVTFGAGETKDLSLFRTHGTAIVRGTHPTEAILRIRCAALPNGLVTNGTPRIELGLAAHALLQKEQPASPVPQVVPSPASAIPAQPVPVERARGASANELELERRISSAKPGWLWLKAGGDKPIGQQMLRDPESGLYHSTFIVRLEKSEGHQKGPEVRARLGYGFAGMSTPWGKVTSAQEFAEGAAAFRQQAAKLNSAPLPVPVEGEFVELIRLQDAFVSVALTYNGKSAPGEVPPQAEKPASPRLARVRARLVDAQGQPIAKRTVFIVPPGQQLEQPPASAATRNDGTIELEIPVGEPFQVMLPRDGSLEGPRSKANMIGERGGPMNQRPTTITGELEIRFDGEKVDAHFRTLKAVEPAAPTGKAHTKEEQVEWDKTRAAALATAMQAIREGKFHILHEAGKHPPELTHDPETGYEIVALPVGGGPGFAELYNEAMRAHYRDRKEAQ